MQQLNFMPLNIYELFSSIALLCFALLCSLVLLLSYFLSAYAFRIRFLSRFYRISCSFNVNKLNVVIFIAFIA